MKKYIGFVLAIVSLCTTLLSTPAHALTLPSSADLSVEPDLSVQPDEQPVDFRQRLVELVNIERSKAGVPALRMESHLTTAAQNHAVDMKTRNYFSHTTPEGKSPTQRMRDAGYVLTGSWSTGENIAKGQTTPEKVMATWMNSSGHRRNILASKFRDIGIGFYQNYWVQDFGKTAALP